MSLPQLRMEKNDLDNVPEIAVSEGYALRTYRPGDEAGIGHIYAASDLGNETAEAVRKKMIEHPCFTPDRLFVIEHADELVGTSAAWIEANDPGVGYLHMVGILPGHRGKRLGAILTVAAIQYSREEGFAAQRLATDDWREAAVRLYLDLGYYPLLTHESHLARWQTIAEKLNRPQALARARNLMA